MANATAEYPAANIPGAGIRFPAEQYVTLANVPVFREHKTRAVDGRMLEFGMTPVAAGRRTAATAASPRRATMPPW